MSSVTVWSPFSLRGQPTAVCRCRPAQGGAEDTAERVLALTTSSPAQGGAEDTEERVLATMEYGTYDKLWRAMLFFSLSTSRPRRFGCMVRSLRWILGLRKSQIAATATAPT